MEYMSKKHLYWFVGIFAVVALAWVLFGYFGVQYLFTETVVSEEVTMEAKTTVADGVFVQGDSTYSISGAVSVIEDSETRMLALTDFTVTNGPDLFVYIVSSESDENRSVKNAVSEGKFVNLGPLKGNIGNQTYQIPEGVVTDENTVVSIWCKRFSRNFGASKIVLK